jgi:hypothetical protein
MVRLLISLLAAKQSAVVVAAEASSSIGEAGHVGRPVHQPLFLPLSTMVCSLMVVARGFPAVVAMVHIAAKGEKKSVE